MSSLSNKYKNVTMDKHDIKTKTLEYDFKYHISESQFQRG